MNVKLAPFIIFMPAAALFGQIALDSGSFSRQETRLTGSVAPQIWGARDFTNVDWRTVRDEDSGRPPAHVAARDYDEGSGPFTREEARDLRAVWHTIRDAENFSDINWRSVGLPRAPGDREARRFMAQDWDSLRRAERFDDINWRAEYHRR
jgi:hypothetical protein